MGEAANARKEKVQKDKKGKDEAVKQATSKMQEQVEKQVAQQMHSEKASEKEQKKAAPSKPVFSAKHFMDAFSHYYETKELQIKKTSAEKEKDMMKLSAPQRLDSSDNYRIS